jgi:ABC-2 type transport system permease protein
MSKLELSSLYQLTMVRFRLFLREPEAIFWIFIFPILLAVGLGIAFRNRPADVLPGGRDDAQLTQALAADKGLTANDDGRGGHACAGDGEDSAAGDSEPEGVAYKYDDTNPDARTARLLADRAIQAAAGRTMRCRPGTNWCMRPARATSTLWCPGCWG